MSDATQRIALSTANSRLVMENEALLKLTAELIADLNEAWSFDNHQQHTHSWHDKQDFMEKWRAAIARARQRP